MEYSKFEKGAVGRQAAPIFSPYRIPLVYKRRVSPCTLRATGGLQKPQPFRHNHDEILHIGDNGGGGQASAIQQLVYHEFIGIYRIEKDR